MVPIRPWARGSERAIDGKMMKLLDRVWRRHEVWNMTASNRRGWDGFRRWKRYNNVGLFGKRGWIVRSVPFLWVLTIRIFVIAFECLTWHRSMNEPLETTQRSIRSRRRYPTEWGNWTKFGIMSIFNTRDRDGFRRGRQWKVESSRPLTYHEKHLVPELSHTS